MIYKALEIRSDGVVAAQVVLEDGDDKDAAHAEVLAWCREKAEVSQPVIEVPSGEEVERRLEEERQTLIQALQSKLNELASNPHSAITESTFAEPGHIYGEATGGRPIGSVTSSDQASQAALADVVKETFDERAKEAAAVKPSEPPIEPSEVAANG